MRILLMMLSVTMVVLAKPVTAFRAVSLDGKTVIYHMPPEAATGRSIWMADLDKNGKVIEDSRRIRLAALELPEGYIVSDRENLGDDLSFQAITALTFAPNSKHIALCVHTLAGYAHIGIADPDLAYIRSVWHKPVNDWHDLADRIGWKDSNIFSAASRDYKLGEFQVSRYPWVATNDEVIRRGKALLIDAKAQKPLATTSGSLIGDLRVDWPALVKLAPRIHSEAYAVGGEETLLGVTLGRDGEPAVNFLFGLSKNKAQPWPDQLVGLRLDNPMIDD